MVAYKQQIGRRANGQNRLRVILALCCVAGFSVPAYAQLDSADRNAERAVYLRRYLRKGRYHDESETN